LFFHWAAAAQSSSVAEQKREHGLLRSDHFTVDFRSGVFSSAARGIGFEHRACVGWQHGDNFAAKLNHAAAGKGSTSLAQHF
jgi:hypothetical protein